MSPDPPTPIARAHPTLSLHLTDSTTFPITSTAADNSQTLTSSSPRPDSSSSAHNRDADDNHHENTTSASLTYLTNTFLTAHENTSRVGFGPALRIGAELKDGTTLSQAYVAPPTAASGSEGSGPAGEGSATLEVPDAAGAANGEGSLGVAGRGDVSVATGNASTMAAAEDDSNPPAMIATVVAPGGSRGEVRAALMELEGVARRLQEEWVRELNGEDGEGEGEEDGRNEGE
ncbi:MAG: hypothetical protein M1819_002624 [Sarea resinae]|nr:MAG: hypothetical protein M1819_002624 [Sarea resinae]